MASTAKYSGLASNLRQLIGLRDNGSVLRAAKRIGVPHATLYAILDGTVRRPQRRTLERIAEAYQRSVEQLLSESWTLASAEDPLAHVRTMWAASVRSLQLPNDVETALLELPLQLDEFALVLGVLGKSAEENEDFRELRWRAVLAYDLVLEQAIALQGLECVRELLMEHADALRFRFSPYLHFLTRPGLLPSEALLTPDRIRNLSRTVPMSPAWDVPSFTPTDGGEMSAAGTEAHEPPTPVTRRQKAPRPAREASARRRGDPAKKKHRRSK